MGIKHKWARGRDDWISSRTRVNLFGVKSKTKSTDTPWFVEISKRRLFFRNMDTLLRYKTIIINLCDASVKKSWICDQRTELEFEGLASVKSHAVVSRRTVRSSMHDVLTGERGHANVNKATRKFLNATSLVRLVNVKGLFSKFKRLWSFIRILHLVKNKGSPNLL